MLVSKVFYNTLDNLTSIGEGSLEIEVGFFILVVFVISTLTDL